MYDYVDWNWYGGYDGFDQVDVWCQFVFGDCGYEFEVVGVCVGGGLGIVDGCGDYFEEDGRSGMLVYGWFVNCLDNLCILVELCDGCQCVGGCVFQLCILVMFFSCVV